MSVIGKLNNIKISENADPEVNRLALAIDLLTAFPDKELDESDVTAEELAARIGHLAALLHEHGARARLREKK